MSLGFVTKRAGQPLRKTGRPAARRTILCAALAPALFAAAALSAEAAGAVSLGDLTVESRPGEPLNAVLVIEDVDLTVSPLLVRVAPPATYLRQGVAWPEQAQDLRIARDGGSGGVRVRVVGEESFKGGFPLLIELNAGGVVTVREYQISPQSGRYVVTASEEHTTVSAQAVQAAKAAAARREAAAAGQPAVPMAPKSRYGDALAQEAPPVRTAAAAEPAEPLQAAKPAEKAAEKTPEGRRRGRSAPEVVKEYVALNGFDAEKPFAIQRDMTLWSIAKLYWPSYPGATLEQLAVAFTDRNPNAFVDGNPARIVVGETLEAPSSALVFSTDAAAAFRAMHGEKTAVPQPTQNLMDAQAVSRECAEAVANAQNAVKRGGASAMADAGRKALDAWKAELAAQQRAGKAPSAAASSPAASAVEEAAPASAAPAPQPGESAQPAKAPQAPEASAAPAAPAAAASTAASAAPAEPAEAASSDQPASPESGASAASSEPAAPAPSETSKPESAGSLEAPAASSAAAGASQSSLFDGISNNMLGFIAVVLLCFLGCFTWMRRMKKDREAAEAEKKPQSGTLAFQKTVAPATEAQLKAVDAAVSEAVKNGTTAGAMGAGTAAYVRAQMAEEKRSAEAPSAPAAAPEAPAAPDASMGASEPTAAAQAAEAAPVSAAPQASDALSAAPAEQPWLSPDDDELPPLDPEEAARKAAPEGIQSAEDILKSVDLSLGGQAADASVAAAPAAAQATAAPLEAPQLAEDRDSAAPAASVAAAPVIETQALEPAPARVPPLESVSIEAEPEEAPASAAAAAAAVASAAIPAPAAAPAPAASDAAAEPAAEPPKTLQAQKEEAKSQALEAKLKLAGSFISLGAVKEARELLLEVRRQGNPEQRERALALEAKLEKTE